MPFIFRHLRVKLGMIIGNWIISILAQHIFVGASDMQNIGHTVLSISSLFVTVKRVCSTVLDVNYVTLQDRTIHNKGIYKQI